MDRIFEVISLLVCAVILTGCTSSAPVDATLPHLDMAEIRKMLNCPHDLTPVCTERVGKPYHCFCADRGALQQILEPGKY